MEKTKFDDRIEELDAQISVLDKERTDLYQQRAKVLCPFKVSDILVNVKGKRVKVVTIKPGHAIRWYSLCPGSGYQLVARNILENGRECGTLHTLYVWDDWHKEESGE